MDDVSIFGGLEIGLWFHGKLVDAGLLDLIGGLPGLMAHDGGWLEACLEVFALAVQGDGLHPGVQQCFALGVGGQHMVVRERRLDPLLGQKRRIACQ